MPFAKSLTHNVMTLVAAIGICALNPFAACSQDFATDVAPRIKPGSGSLGVMPYFVLDKTETGEEIEEYRVKIWGRGIPFDERPGEGFELRLDRARDGKASVLGSRDLMKKLELTSDQSKEIVGMRKVMFKQLSTALEDRFGNADGKLTDSDKSEISELLKKITADHDDLAWQVLVPRQQTQLRSLYASRSLTLEAIGSIADSVLKKELDLSDKQVEELMRVAGKAKAEIEDAKSELNKKIIAIREEAKQKIMDTLSEEQRLKLKELMADSNQDKGDGHGGR